MEFRERLYQLRRQAGLSQEELANVLDLSRQAVQKWESGASRPDMDNLVALAEYFHVTLDYLVCGTEPAPGPGPVQPAPVCCPQWYHYEYKSSRTLFGLPLVHINVGRGLHWARGIVAIGNVATGLVALGGFSAGLCAVGGISAGLLSLAGIALGGAAAGGVALGAAAFGACAIGLLSVGVCAVGQFAAGISAYGNALAVGMAALSPAVEIGREVSGQGALSLSLEVLRKNGATIAQTAAQAAPYLPGAPEWLIRFFLGFVL